MGFFLHLKKQAVIVAAVALWVPTVAFGVNVLLKYSTTPGDPGTPPTEWPRNSPIEREIGRADLVMFVHPQCPCSRASLGELAIIMAHSPKLEATVFFYLPAQEASAWARTDLWRTAAAIPGVHVLEDPAAATARTFGALTSGQTLLYNPDGHLLFRGGITGFRGHSGDNAGRSAILALLEMKTPWHNTSPVRTPVLGCSLIGE